MPQTRTEQIHLSQSLKKYEKQKLVYWRSERGQNEVIFVIITVKECRKLDTFPCEPDTTVLRNDIYT